MLKKVISLFLVLIFFAVLVIKFVDFRNLSPVYSFYKQDYLLNKTKYPPYIKGVYINSWSAANSEKFNYLLDLIKTTELNAAVIDIKEVDGKVVFDTQSKLIDELGTEVVIVPNLKEVVERLHKENIYTIARIVVFKDGFLSKIKPELALKNRQGRLWKDWAGRTWLDPASKEVWDYHIELAKEAIKIGFDEINFDYVRFPSDGDISQIIYPFWDNKKPKSEVIKDFFVYIRKNLNNFDVFISADLFGLTLWRENDDMNIGQVLEYAVPYFDFICPMVYPSHYPEYFEGFKNPVLYPYEVIKLNLEKGLERIKGGRARLRPWLQDFDMGANYDAEKIRQQKQAVYDTGAYGWLLWNPGSVYTKNGLEIEN